MADLISDGGQVQEMLPTMSRQLASFVAGSQLEAIPAHVRHHAVLALFNAFAAGLAGAGDDVIARLGVAFESVSGTGNHGLIGSAGRHDIQSAAFINAATMNVLDFDDTHIPTIIHPTSVVAPAVLALAERLALSGAEALHALVLGMEVTCRIGNAVTPGHYARGWHITATCGIFGAAAACAKLLGLDEQATLWALGNASSQAGGLVETLGFMSKSVGVGAAARGGLMSAIMAKGGVQGPPLPLEGPRGFVQVTSDRPEFERLHTGLGEEWDMLQTMFKPYPCGVVLNPVIDASLTARNLLRIDPAQVSSIVVTGNPLLRNRADRPAITAGREAQVSAQHAIAASLLKGAAGAAEFSDAAVADPHLRAFRAKVRSVEVDQDIPIEAVRLRIELTNGEAVDVEEVCARGSAARPMDDGDLSAKMTAAAKFGCPGLDCEPLADALWNVRDVPEASILMKLANPADSDAAARHVRSNLLV
ncbi:MmgE/PrpD family protein [Sphingobium sp. EP60837]|uniref:MmgE/PrpD family protein n=1 Tax=Sphingobium sp. EP60837 TaxID=1855519 RepID=UPI0007DD6D23|nr:MmgE/PrpD family protein [Sphingobium sp. EP60837]ANI80202.1 Aconitate decarboxylase [Sphingobium sp. EP60837]